MTAPSAAPSRAGFPFWLDDDPARILRGRLEAAGVRAWATGACVRDAVLGRRAFAPPVVELLVETDDGTLAGLADAFALGPGGGPRFAPRAIGTDPAASPEAAAAGRDFTANAILCALDGELRDPLGGQADILARRVRLAAPSSLRDDPVRVIRLARMRALLGEDEPDPEALAESLAYGSRAALGEPDRALSELARLMRVGPAAALGRALSELDANGALDGLALAPAPDRVVRLVEACAGAGLPPPSPAGLVGTLCAVRVRGGPWIDGLRPRPPSGSPGDLGRPAAILSSRPSGSEAPLARLLRAVA